MTSAVAIEDVLRGTGSVGAQSAVLLNAAAALYVGQDDGTFGDAVQRTRRAMAEGVGLTALHRLREASNALQAPSGRRTQ